MRADPAPFAEANLAPQKSPRFVIEVAFDSDNTILWHFTSHAATPVPAGASVVQNVLRALSTTSQKLNPDTANATLGSISFDLVDRASQVTTVLGGEIALGRSTRLQRVRAFAGFEGLAFADFVLVQTQLVDDIDYLDGVYTFNCLDIQREIREEIFDPAITNLQSTVGIGATTINVFDTAAFELLAHGTSFTDAPSATVGYIKIDLEVIRYTGKTATAFTGCVRGALNTMEAEHVVDPSQSADRRTKVTEYIYLEMPAVKLIPAILTGVLEGQGGATLPSGWHEGVDPAFVRLGDFTGIGLDWWDPADDTVGFPVRFEGLKKRKGKEFIEKQLLLLLGAFMPVYADGALGLRRMAEVTPGAAYSGQIDETNCVSHGRLKHGFKVVHNVFVVKWNFEPIQDRTTRTNKLIGADSITVHKKGELLELEFLGLHGSRHTEVALRSRFDALRDRYAGPPLLLDVKLKPSLNPIEVGDVRRVKLPTLREFNANSTVDSSFEVQQVAVDWDTGAVNAKLFGSSRAAEPLAATSDTVVLSDAWYSSEGTDATTVLTAVGSAPVHITANGTLAGGADMNAAASIFYIDDDAVIDVGVVVSLIGNVQLRVKGFLTINGTLDGKGGGHAGAASPGAVFRAVTPGTPGFLGTTVAGGSILVIAPANINTGFDTVPGGITRGLHDSIPPLTLVWDGTTLSGFHTDLRATSGSSGGVTAEGQFLLQEFRIVGELAAGGAGGAGGAGLIVVCRGAAFGVNGKVDVSGGDGQIGGFTTTLLGRSWYAGSGGGGAPGPCYFILDGALVTVPELTPAHALAFNGRGPIPAGASVLTQPSLFSDSPPGAYYSFYAGQAGTPSHPVADLSGARGAFRVQFVPGNVAAEADPLEAVLVPPTGLGLASGNDDLFTRVDGTIGVIIKVTWTASVDNRVRGYDIEFKRSIDSVWTAIPPVIGISTQLAWVAVFEDGINYDVRIRAADGLRGVSDWVTVTAFLVAGKTIPPSDVLGASLAFDGVFLTWTDIADLDRLGYVLRFQPSAQNDWNTATPAHNVGHVTETRFDTRKLVGSSTRLLVRAKDTSKLLSAIAATLVVDLRPADVVGLAFDDTFFTWTANTEGDLLGYIVRFQPSAQNDWNTASPAHETGHVTETRFDTRALVGGSTRLLIRALDEAGNLSAVATTLVVDLRPPAPDVFTVLTQADGTRQFDFGNTTPPSDLDGRAIRWAFGATSDWATMTALHDGLLVASPFETNQLAAGSYTFAIKNFDFAGNESETPTFITGTLPNPRIPAFVHRQTEEPTWAGTKTSCHVDAPTGWLIADDTTTTWQQTWGQWNPWARNPTSPIQYEIEIDLGVIFTFVPLVTVFADGALTIEESHSDDGIAFSPYVTAGPELTTRVIRLRITVSGTYPKIKNMRTILGGKPVRQITEDVDTSTLTGDQRIGVGHIRIELTEPFRIVKTGSLTLQSVGPGWSWELIDKTDLVKGTEFKIYNGAGAPADALVDATIDGL